MKKVLLSAIAVMTFGISNAQEETATYGFSEGDVFFTGAIGYGSESTGDVTDNEFVVAPKVGFFVTENIALGLQVNLSSSKYDNGNDGNLNIKNVEKNSRFTGGVFGRYYFTPASQFSLFANLGIEFGSNKNTDDVTIANVTTSTETKSAAFGGGLGLGVNYFISSNFALEATWAGLTYNSFDNGGGAGVDKTNNFGIAANLASINLGLVYKL